MNPVELQRQIKDNAEDVRRFVSDLNSWEEEMKRKETDARSATSKESSVPAIRNTSKKRDSGDTNAAHSLGEAQGSKKRISSSDYAAWEKFDVEKACEEVDDPTRKKSESEEERLIREKRLRDEANVEKEKGNQFVKNEKWDKAIVCYSKAIKCYSRDATYYCNRALCYLKKTDYRAAETDCTSALALDSMYVKAFHRRGLARKELNQLEEALEDLQSACDIEPNNTAVCRDCNTVRMKIAQLSIDSLLDAGVIESEAEIVTDINSVKKPDPILPAKKHRPPSSTTKKTSANKESAISVNWPNIEDSVVVEPIIIPPHKRSKKPLVRIQIQEDGDIATACPSGEADLPVPSSTEISVNLAPPEALQKCLQSKKIVELSSPYASNGNTGASSAKPGGAPLVVHTSKLEVTLSSVPEAIPPVPKNSVQFLAGWRQINKNSSMCFQYLKQINGEELPKIFQDSLDGNILSQILDVLSKEFIAADVPVLSYLHGLTQVRRFRTLTLFLSQSDKKNMDALLKHMQKLEEASPDILATLKKEYEL